MSQQAAFNVPPIPESTRAEWDRVAPGYDRTNTPTQMWLGDQGLRRAGLGRGMQFLDVAAGSGALSIPAARLGATVLATDQSPVMLTLLSKRAESEGLQMQTRAMDGHALDLDDDSFDVAGSQFGVMLFPDMPRGLREMARVVRPGGRVLMTVYGDPRKIDFLGFFVRAVQSVRADFSGPPADPPPLPFQLQDPARLERELIGAGLKDVSVETVTETTEHRTGDDLWEWLIWSNPIVDTILDSIDLSDTERTKVRRTLDRLVRERAGTTGAAKLTNPVHIGVGTK